MGFTRSESSILLIALVSFLQLSEVVSSSVVKPLGITTPPCAPGSRTFVISTNNVQQITVCFDYTRQAAIWTYHVIDGQDLNNAPSGLKRKDNWGVDGLDKDVIQTVTTSGFYKDVYKKETHNKGANTPKEYLARGHLTPNADFGTQDKRDATFFFINAAPQWQYFNGGSWKSLEKAITNYAQAGTGRILHVITGTDGILNGGALNGGKDWYLDWQSGDNMKIPVPKFFWKIVYDGNSGAAFVGSNEDVRGAKGPQAQGKGHPITGGQVKTDLCNGSYNNVNQGYIWCYTIKDVFEVLPKLKKYALPLKTKIEKNAQFLAL